MRYIVVALAMIPSALHFAGQVRHHFPESGGRGMLHPPTVAELKQIECLATMVYGEARGESKQGKVAVAYTALNRATKKSVCDVVLAPMQYSIFNDNPQLRAAALDSSIEPKFKNVIERNAWKESWIVAHDVMRKAVPDPTKGSTHYLAPVAMKQLGYEYPQWSKQYTHTTTIDGHKFYKPFYPREGKQNAFASI